MAIRQKPPICTVCKEGHVTRRMEEIAFRQWSDLGFMCCRVAILIGNCDNCHARSLDPGSEKVFGEAFQQEYARQARLKDKNRTAQLTTARLATHRGSSQSEP